jgi:hypothetical protein
MSLPDCLTDHYDFDWAHLLSGWEWLLSLSSRFG